MNEAVDSSSTEGNTTCATFLENIVGMNDKDSEFVKYNYMA